MKRLQMKVVPLVLCAMILVLRGAIPVCAASILPGENTTPPTSIPAAGFHAMVLQIADDPVTGDDSDDSDDDDDDGDDGDADDGGL